VTVALPVFKHEFEQRLKAIDLLKPENSEAIDWALVERHELKADLETLIKGSLADLPMDKIEVHKLNPEARRWILENRKILETFK